MQRDDRRSSGRGEVHGAAVAADDNIRICKQRSQLIDFGLTGCDEAGRSGLRSNLL